MEDDEGLILFIFIVVAVYLWINLHEKKERERLRQEQAALDEEKEQQRSLISLKQRSPIPGYIRNAIREFEADFKLRGSAMFSGQSDISPLKYYGYAVGKSSPLSLSQRRYVIEVTYHADLPGIFPLNYKEKWGEAGSYKRYSKITSHIKNQADRRRTNRIYRVAVAHWDEDRSWFVNEFSKVALIRKRCGL